MPAREITINGEAATLPSTGAVFWGVGAIAFLMVLVIGMLPYLPGKVGGGRRV